MGPIGRQQGQGREDLPKGCRERLGFAYVPERRRIVGVSGTTLDDRRWRWRSWAPAELSFRYRIACRLSFAHATDRRVMRLDRTTPERNSSDATAWASKRLAGATSHRWRNWPEGNARLARVAARIRTAWSVCVITFDCTAQVVVATPIFPLRTFQHARSGSIVVTRLPKSGACRAGIMYCGFSIRSLLRLKVAVPPDEKPIP